MFFQVAREEARSRLASAGYVHEGDFAPGVERWRHPAGHHIGLTPEDDGSYEEEMIKRAEAQA